MRKKILSAIIVSICAIGLSGYIWVDYDRFDPLQDVFILEYGSSLSEDPAEYIDAIEEKLTETKLDLSNVNMEQVGEYEVTAICGEKKVVFTISVEDTVPPEIQLKEKTVNGVRGKAIPASDIMEVTDKAGIKDISFNQGQVELEEKDLLTSVGLKFDEVGEYDVVITAIDGNGLETEETVSVKIVEDYLAHVSGMKDIIVEKGSKIDWMKGIKGDERILEVTADASKVKMDQEGTYELTYVIRGDDKETTVRTTVKVTVVSPSEAQKLADQGEVVRITGGTKQKTPVYIPSRRSESGGSGRNSGGSSGASSGGSSHRSSSSGSKSSGGSSGGEKNTWESEPDSGGYIGGGNKDSNGNTWESGSFTW